jgi:hypothetical protein
MRTYVHTYLHSTYIIHTYINYIYIHTYVHTLYIIHTCIYKLYIHTHTYVHTCIHYTYNIHINTHTCIHIYIYIYTHTHIRTYVRTYTHKHTHTHTHTIPLAPKLSRSRTITWHACLRQLIRLYLKSKCQQMLWTQEGTIIWKRKVQWVFKMQAVSATCPTTTYGV